MQPTKSQVHVDKILTNIAVAYRNKKYIYRELSPFIPVKYESDKYYKFPKARWFTNEAALRAPGTKARLSGFPVSTDSYNCDEFALATKIADRVLANTDSPLTLRSAKAAYVADKVEMARDIELATLVNVTSQWGTDKTLTTTWDSDASTPIEDIIDAQDTVGTATGEELNTGVLGRLVWSKLRRHPDILDILSSVERSIATPQLLAQAFDIDRILIGRSIKNTANPAQTASMSQIWGKHAFFAYVAPSPGIMSPSALYTFMSRDARVRTWYDEPEEATYIESGNVLDFKIVAPDVGYFIDVAVA